MKLLELRLDTAKAQEVVALLAGPVCCCELACSAGGSWTMAAKPEFTST